MPIRVKVDTRELERIFRKIEKRFPRITVRAINETATWARNRSEKEVARDIRLPLKFVKKRFYIWGGVKEDRTVIYKARGRRMIARLGVYMRGIPVGQVAGKPTKRQYKRPGVKAKGGRLYKGAFYAPGALPYGHVFKQMHDTPSKRRRGNQLMMPKIGVRRKLKHKFDLYIVSHAGRAEFRRRWDRLAKFEVSKITR